VSWPFLLPGGAKSLLNNNTTNRPGPVNLRGAGLPLSDNESWLPLSNRVDPSLTFIRRRISALQQRFIAQETGICMVMRQWACLLARPD
jgi:hypothetical protein